MGKRAKPRVKTHPWIQIRYNDDGTVDEIIVKNPDDPRHCLLHLEQMSDESYWIGLQGVDEWPIHIDLYSDKPITARVRI